MNRNVLIDGGNLLHRAYHVFVSDNPDPLTSRSGYPTGLIYGCVNMLVNWIETMERFTAVHMFLDGVPMRRRQYDPTYKVKDASHRPMTLNGKSVKLSDGYVASDEIDVLSHVMQLLGVVVYHHSEEEADDLIASFVRKFPDDVSVIISSDKDFFQLLTNPRVVVYRPDAKGRRLLDAEGAEEYWGTLQKGSHPRVPVAHVRMFKSLCGDTSDGISGVPRFRKKVAANLCKQGSLEAIFASEMVECSATERENLKKLKDQVMLNYRLVGLVDDLNLDSMSRSMTPDLAMAKKILLDDLDIHLGINALVPTGIGRVRFSGEDAAPAKILADDWLSGI